MSSEGQITVPDYYAAGKAVACWWGGMGATSITRSACDGAQQARLSANPGSIISTPPMSATVAGFLMPRQTEACVTEEDRWWQAWRSEGRVEIALVACFAGSAAQARHRKRSVAEMLKREGASDSAHADSLSDANFESPERAAIARDLGLTYAKALVRSHKGWAAMTSIAGALMRTGELGASQVDELCHDTYGERPLPCGWDPYWPPGFDEVAAGDLPTDDVPWPIPEDPGRRAYVFASVSFGPWAMYCSAAP